MKTCHKLRHSIKAAEFADQLQTRHCERGQRLRPFLPQCLQGGGRRADAALEGRSVATWRPPLELQPFVAAA